MEELIKRLEVDLQDVQHLWMKATQCSYEWEELSSIESDIKKALYKVRHLKEHKAKRP